MGSGGSASDGTTTKLTVQQLTEDLVYKSYIPKGGSIMCPNEACCKLRIGELKEWNKMCDVAYVVLPLNDINPDGNSNTKTVKQSDFKEDLNAPWYKPKQLTYKKLGQPAATFFLQT